LTPEQKEKTKFFWYRDHTRYDPDYSIKEYDTIKLIKDIVESPTVNYQRLFKIEDILLIDDS